MKIITPILVITAAAFLNMAGCASVKEAATPENVRTTTFIACSGILNAFPPQDKAEAAAYVYAVAHAIRTFEGGNVPSPAELEATIKAFTPNAGKWTQLSAFIATAWRAAYPRIGGNGKIAMDYLEALAAGAEDAARPINPIPLFSPIPSKSPGIGGNPPPPGSRPSPKPSPSDPVPTSGPDFSAPPTA